MPLNSAAPELTSAATGAVLPELLKLVSTMLPIALCRGHVCKFCVIAVQSDYGFAFVWMHKTLSLTFMHGCPDMMCLIQIDWNTLTDQQVKEAVQLQVAFELIQAFTLLWEIAVCTSEPSQHAHTLSWLARLQRTYTCRKCLICCASPDQTFQLLSLADSLLA